MLGKPIPEGLRRERISRRTKSIDRLDRIIKLGGAVGEMFSILESDVTKIGRKSIHSDFETMSFDDLDLETRADSASYSLYGKLINKECRSKGIPSPYPGDMDWAFRNTKDRVKIVNALIYLLIQRRAAENVIVGMKAKIEILEEEVRSAEVKNKKLTEIILEKDERLAHLNPAKEIKRKTDAYHAREELFRQKEETFQKEADTRKKREEQMEIDFKKLTNELALTKKAKTDVERKHRFLQNQKRNLEIQHRNIQKRLKSKLDKVSKKSTSNLDIKQIDEFTLFETNEEKRLRKRKEPQKIVKNIVDEWNQNILSNLEELKVENDLLRSELEDFKQKNQVLIENRYCCKLPESESFGPPLPNSSSGRVHAEQSWGKQSVYEFYFDRLIEIFTEFVPDSVDEIPLLLETYPEKEHFIYERVCYQFGISPIAEYVGPAPTTARTSLTETKRTRSGINRSSFRCDELKTDFTQKVARHRSTFSINSASWLDDSGMDSWSVELDKGWSFAESCSAVSPYMEGHSPIRSAREKNHSPNRFQYHSPLKVSKLT